LKSEDAAIAQTGFTLKWITAVPTYFETLKQACTSLSLLEFCFTVVLNLSTPKLQTAQNVDAYTIPI